MRKPYDRLPPVPLSSQPIRSLDRLANDLRDNLYFYGEWRRRLKRRQARRHRRMSAGLPTQVSDPNQANWHGLATTAGGRRFQVGLKGSSGCQYGRCLNCFLFHEAACAHIEPEHILTQFQRALTADGLRVAAGIAPPAWDDPALADVDRCDFNGSGSFLNDNEMPDRARRLIFAELAARPFRTVLIESRIEYVDFWKVRELRRLLRPDQRLEVGIGLESASYPIREMAIGKGYALDDFEACVTMLAKESVDVLVYSLIKPAFISESEALEDSVSTGRYLAKLAERVRQRTGSPSFRMVQKLEPAFIQAGGFLHFLQKLGRASEDEGGRRPLYYTPWSFTTCEIVRRLIADGSADRVGLQIGRSADFPPPFDVTRNRDDPADLTANGGRESTAILNQALQDYNADHDAQRFMSALAGVIESYPRTYAAWRDVVLNLPPPLITAPPRKSGRAVGPL